LLLSSTCATAVCKKILFSSGVHNEEKSFIFYINKSKGQIKNVEYIFSKRKISIQFRHLCFQCTLTNTHALAVSPVVCLILLAHIYINNNKSIDLEVIAAANFQG
jgi:hypothetical protein